MASSRHVLAFAAFLLCATCGSSSEASAASWLSYDAQAAKSRPVSKVIKLLKDMLNQLTAEREEDEEVYDSLACWCESNDKEKTASIAAAEAHIADLTSKIQGLTAKSAGLTTEIKGLEKEMAQSQATLAQATGLREKQLSEFNSEEKDLVESIAALKAAIVVLSKKPSSLLQTSDRKRHFAGVAASVEREMKKHSAMLAGALTHGERRAVISFIQAHQDDFFDAEPTFKQAYAPQSGDILGILTQMKETFESNLSAAQKEAIADSEAYDSLNKAKKVEIAASAEQLDKKTMELADTDEKNARATEDLEDTKNALSADEKFLLTVKEKCASADKEYEKRKAIRLSEMEAVAKALSLLSSDDAHDLFTKTFNAALLQRVSFKHSRRRSQASRVLTSMARKLHSSGLSEMAVKVRLDTFDSVKKAIDVMIVQLLKEKEDEIKHKEFCHGAIDKNRLRTEKAMRQEEVVSAQVDELRMTIKGLEEDIHKLLSEVKEMKFQVKRAGEDREKENKDFQMTIEDQRATQQLLVSALKVLKRVYDEEASLLQSQGGSELAVSAAPSPAGFKEYKSNEKAGGVMGLIQQIIEDAKAEEHEAIVAETDAQKAYEAFVKATGASISYKEKEIINKGESKAHAESDESVGVDREASIEDTLNSLGETQHKIDESCDFVLANFKIRQAARDEEVEALKEAKFILSGANFGAFLQSLPK
mmetsp:Transcript_134243/g.233269  ORF Transcript_134243/g.233269 Transcript_134243/m.233269 type:complete len:706 (+) Transcript_134243:51-2168(+)